MRLSPHNLLLLATCSFAALAGCHHARSRECVATAPATDDDPRAVYDQDILAVVRPPDGWKMEVKPQQRSNVAHHMWISPSGRTAFGVIRFTLPLPLPHDPVLWVFLGEMRSIEGEARMLSKVWDGRLRGIRFDVEGGRYRMRTNFTIRNMTGWMAYAGTVRDDLPVDAAELLLAEQAREATRFGER